MFPEILTGRQAGYGSHTDERRTEYAMLAAHSSTAPHFDDVADPVDWLVHLSSLPACGCYTSTLCHGSHALSLVQC